MLERLPLLAACALAASAACSSSSPTPSMEGDSGVSEGDGGVADDSDVGLALRRVDTSLYLPTVTLNATTGIIIMNGLDLGPLTVASIDSEELAELNSDALSSSGETIGHVGRQILAYAYSCALPASSSMQLEIGGETWEFNGLLGLAPEWESGACDVECQEWVSACILSRTNQFGTKVKLSLRGDHPALTTTSAIRGQYTLREGSFYGNIFTNADKIKGNAYACAGGEGSAIWEMTNRFCSAIGDGCPITTVADCNITNFACDATVTGCSSNTACSDWNGDGLPTTCYSEKHACGQATAGTSYSRIITAYLEAPVHTCGDGFCAENEKASCSADCGGQWAASFGSGCHEDTGGLSVDGTGNIAVVGRFMGDMAMGSTMHSTDSKFDRDLFVASMTPSGDMRWSNAIDSSGDHGMVRSVIHDSSDNLIVAGHFANETDLGAPAGPAVADGYTFFVAKYAAANGDHMWSKTFTTGVGLFDNNLATIPTITLANHGDGFVIAAAFIGTLDLGLGGQNPSSEGSYEDIIVARFDSDGSLDWHSVLATPEYDVLDKDGNLTPVSGSAAVGGVAVDGQGEVVVVGDFSGRLTLGGLAMLESDTDDADGYIVKLSSLGVHQWRRSITGSTATQQVLGVAIGAGDAIAIVGSYIGDTQIAGASVISSAVDIEEGLLTNPDAFVAQFKKTGELEWSTNFGSGRSDIAQQVAWNGEDSFVVSAVVTSELGGTVNVESTVIDAGEMGDIALIRYGIDGVVQSVTHHPTPVTEQAKGLVASGDEVTIAGEFMGTLRFGGEYVTNAGGSSNSDEPSDIFVTHIATLP